MPDLDRCLCLLPRRFSAAGLLWLVIAAFLLASSASASAAVHRQSSGPAQPAQKHVAAPHKSAALPAKVSAARRLLRAQQHRLKHCLRRHHRHPARCRAARRAKKRAAARLASLLRLLKAAQPASPKPASVAPAQPAASSAAASAPGFEMGAVVGSVPLYELPWLQRLGAHTARIEFDISTPAAQLAPVVEAYARAGIRPLLLAGFNARTPTTNEAQNLASWAAAYGPGGTFWRGRNLPASMAVTNIEFGNETNNPWQYGSNDETWWDEPAFILRAEEYARRLRDAQAAIAGTGIPVGLLGIGDEYGGHTTWVEAMFRAVPNLGTLVAGWTIHPYGPIWKTSIDNMINITQAHGAPSDVPIYATEWGLSTDNGRCLSDNFGWNKCMTYQEAAEVLGSTIAGMRGRYGSRLRAVYLFQARDQKPSGSGGDREVYFGALQSNQDSKGAYTSAVQSLLAANP